MPETEHPGVYVEEAGAKPKPIEGVPTGNGDALTSADRRRWLIGIVVGGTVLAGLGIGLVMSRGALVLKLFGMPWWFEGFLALFGAALLLNVARALVERHRRLVGQPPLRYGKLTLGLAAFVLATLIALGLCILAWAASLLVAPSLSSDFLSAAVNILVGYLLIRLPGGALRDLLLLLQAVRNEP